MGDLSDGRSAVSCAAGAVNEKEAANNSLVGLQAADYRQPNG